MIKGFGLIALCLSIEAAFLYQAATPRPATLLSHPAHAAPSPVARRPLPRPAQAVEPAAVESTEEPCKPVGRS